MKTHFKIYDDTVLFNIEAENEEEQHILSRLRHWSTMDLLHKPNGFEIKIDLKFVRCPECGEAADKLMSFQGKNICSNCILEYTALQYDEDDGPDFREEN